MSCFDQLLWMVLEVHWEFCWVGLVVATAAVAEISCDEQSVEPTNALPLVQL